jgi:hypothetical protein
LARILSNRVLWQVSIILEAISPAWFLYQPNGSELGLVHELVPKVDLIVVLLNPNNPFFDDQSQDLNDASRALGLKIRIEGASNEHEIASAFATFAREHTLVGADPYFNSQRPLVIAPAVQLRLPANGESSRKQAG